MLFNIDDPRLVNIIRFIFILGHFNQARTGFINSIIQIAQRNFKEILYVDSLFPQSLLSKKSHKSCMQPELQYFVSLHTEVVLVGSHVLIEFPILLLSNRLFSMKTAISGVELESIVAYIASELVFRFHRKLLITLAVDFVSLCNNGSMVLSSFKPIRVCTWISC